MSDGIRVILGGLWVNETKDGRKYMSGGLGLAKLLIFKNDRKEPGSNAPDYTMYLVPKERKDGGGDVHGPLSGSDPVAEYEAPDSDLPF